MKSLKNNKGNDRCNNIVLLSMYNFVMKGQSSDQTEWIRMHHSEPGMTSFIYVSCSPFHLLIISYWSSAMKLVWPVMRYFKNINDCFFII